LVKKSQAYKTIKNRLKERLRRINALRTGELEENLPLNQEALDFYKAKLSEARYVYVQNAAT